VINIKKIIAKIDRLSTKTMVNLAKIHPKKGMIVPKGGHRQKLDRNV
jgi:hypothetical protein